MDIVHFESLAKISPTVLSNFWHFLLLADIAAARRSSGTEASLAMCFTLSALQRACVF